MRFGFSDPVATTIERIVVDEGDNVGCGGSTSSTTELLLIPRQPFYSQSFGYRACSPSDADVGIVSPDLI